MDRLVATKLGDGFVLVDDRHLLDSVAPFVAVIVPVQSAARFYVGDHGRADAFWAPTVADTLGVARAIRERDWQDHPRIGRELGRYRFQIVGIVVGERRVVFANAFCEEQGDWKKQPVVVDDGGDCYFQVSLDPTTGAIAKLTVNGEA